MSERALEVVEAGPLSTIQDAGRPGLAALGIGGSGPADHASYRLANRLVGNDEDDAAVEVTFGGLEVRSRGGALVAVTGAPCPLLVDGHGVGGNAPTYLPDGATLRLGQPVTGMRSYLAVSGGIDVPLVLGSRSTDVLAGIGPPALERGTVLPLGVASRAEVPVDVAPVHDPPVGELTLEVVAGPRDDWFTAAGWDTLLGTAYEVTSESNRVGMRLDGEPLERARSDELPSEGMVPGAVQVPASGLPTLFLADHPVTGGYPVIAVVVRRDVDRAAQARPGQSLRFRLAGRTPA